MQTATSLFYEANIHICFDCVVFAFVFVSISSVEEKNPKCSFNLTFSFAFMLTFSQGANNLMSFYQIITGSFLMTIFVPMQELKSCSDSLVTKLGGRSAASQPSAAMSTTEPSWPSGARTSTPGRGGRRWPRATQGSSPTPASRSWSNHPTAEPSTRRLGPEERGWSSFSETEMCLYQPPCFGSSTTPRLGL